MPFPISLSGTVAAADLTVEQAIERLVGALDDAKADALRREGDVVHFRGGFFRLVSNWNILGPIARGVLEISPSAPGISVRYRVTFSLLPYLILLVVGEFLGLQARDASASIMWPCLMGLSFVTNFLATWFRWPPFLDRSLSRPTR